MLGRAQGALDEEDYKTVKAVVESYAYVAEIVGDKNTTIRRLRKLLFGAITEKTENVVGSVDHGYVYFGGCVDARGSPDCVVFQWSPACGGKLDRRTSPESQGIGATDSDV